MKRYLFFLIVLYDCSGQLNAGMLKEINQVCRSFDIHRVLGPALTLAQDRSDYPAFALRADRLLPILPDSVVRRWLYGDSGRSKVQ